MSEDRRPGLPDESPAPQNGEKLPDRGAPVATAGVAVAVNVAFAANVRPGDVRPGEVPSDAAPRPASDQE